MYKIMFILLLIASSIIYYLELQITMKYVTIFVLPGSVIMLVLLLVVTAYRARYLSTCARKHIGKRR